MKRRDFLKKSSVAVGLAGSLKLVPPLTAAESGPPVPSGQTGGPPEDNRSADYLRRVQDDKLLPKPPAHAESSRPADVHISPMPLAERIRRKIVPQRGFCSLAPGSGALLSGNGAVSIELACDPYTEQIPFRHEMLYVPHRRPFEAPKIAEIFPQVRQMLLDGKYHEAAEIRLREMARRAPSRGAAWDSAEAEGSPCVLSFRHPQALPRSQPGVGQGLSPHS